MALTSAKAFDGGMTMSSVPWRRALARVASGDIAPSFSSRICRRQRDTRPRNKPRTQGLLERDQESCHILALGNFITNAALRRYFARRIELLCRVTPLQLGKKLLSFDRVHDFANGNMPVAGQDFHLEICSLSGNLIGRSTL
jgi:hypothetical protein